MDRSSTYLYRNKDNILRVKLYRSKISVVRKRCSSSSTQPSYENKSVCGNASKVAANQNWHGDHPSV